MSDARANNRRKLCGKSQIFVNTNSVQCERAKKKTHETRNFRKLMLLAAVAFLGFPFSDLSGKDTKVATGKHHFLSCSIVNLYVFCSVVQLHVLTCLFSIFERHSFCYHFWFLDLLYRTEFTTF